MVENNFFQDIECAGITEFTCSLVSVFFILASNNLYYLSSVELISRTSQEEGVHSKLSNFSKDILQCIVKVLRSSSEVSK